MRFISPLSLLWLLPIGGLIVLMYILKLRRKDVIVSSTFLWRQVIRDVQANAPFQKLRKNLLLFLQLLIAALLIFALARPFLRVTGVGGRNIVLVMDTSASMGATDVAPTRLEAAKRAAHDLINGLKPGDKMMVLSSSSRPEAVTGFTEERAELHRAVDGLKPHETAASLRDALSLAADLVASRNQGENGRIELLSDGGADGQGGAFPALLANLNLGKARLAFHPVGTARDNIGITAVDFRRNLGGEKSVQVLVVAHNYSAKPRTFTEEISADDNLIDAREVTLPPNGEDTQPYDIPEPDAPVTLHIRLDAKDDLAADNAAALLLTPRKTVRALLVGQTNLFLENALKVDPGVELSKTETFTSGKGFDVVVFNGAAPAKLPPGNYLFLHCASDQAPVKAGGEEENVAPADWDKEHPVMRYVDFGNDRFGKALAATTQVWGKELAVGESGTLVAVGEKDGARSVFVGFSLTESLFPLRIAFPILIANSARWLGTGDDTHERGQIATGSPLTIPAPPGLGALTVTRPDGSKREIQAAERGGAAFDEADQVGLYRVEGKGFSYAFAANLASASESDTAPRRDLVPPDTAAPAAERRVTTTQELLPWLAALALFVLVIEWWAFHRRVYVN